MPRFYIPPALWNPGSLVLDADESHHATHVLRLKTGDRVTVFNGEGARAVAEITGGGKRALELRALEVTNTPKPACRIVLGQAVPKGKTFDFIVQKATELGASGVVPLLTEHTVVQCDDARDAERKRNKWRTVAVEACKQCGQDWLPEVATPQRLDDLLARAGEFDLLLVASLQPGARHPKAVLAETRAAGAEPKSALILVGPEGDFSEAEIARALAVGCKPITLGPIVLRAETAALYCLSVLGYELLGESR